jgi:hypothetical protein
MPWRGSGGYPWRRGQARHPPGLTALRPEHAAARTPADPAISASRSRPGAAGLFASEHAERPTPQRRAYDSPADILGYGGAAGGGKSDLLLGLAITRHERSLLLRREAKQGRGIIVLSQFLRDTPTALA